MEPSKMKNWMRVLPFTFLAMAFSPFLKSQTETCLNQKCHTSMLEKKNIHPVVRLAGCVACHIVETAPTDSNGRHESKLLMEGNDLCFLCHPTRRTQGETSKHPHVPVSISCLLCHNPHGTDHPRMLIQPVPSLCITCHPATGHQILTEWHKPIKEGHCTKCHDIHGSDNPRLTRADGRKLCYTCHWLKGKEGPHSVKTAMP
jgi:predicted CXXCH cytochrome family protein